MKRLISLILATGFISLSSIAQSKTLVYCSEGSPESFNPQLSTSGTTFDASSRQVYNRLYQFVIGATEVEPGLAESVDISEDGLEYTFHLRKGVKLHKTSYFTPTRDFNADDVLFTFNRQGDSQHPYHSVSGGVYKYFIDMGMDALIKDIIKVDDYSVKFVLNRPDSPFLANLSMDFASILSKEYADTLMKAGTPEQIDQKPIGTGPFKFQRYAKDSFIRYEAHEDYWKGRESIDKLVFAISVDPNARLTALRKGECHVMSYPLPAQINTIREDKSLSLQEKPSATIGYWAFNTEKAPLNDVRVRKALAMAINKEKILNTIYAGTGQSARNFIPPILWSHNDAITDIEYNPEAAKALLKEAGFEKGLEIDLWAMPVQRPYNPNARRMAELMQADLNEVGVNAKIVSYEWGEYLTRARNGEHQTMLMGWTGDNGDPDNFYSPLLSCDAAKTGGNFARYCNDDFQALLTQARTIADVQERTKLYEQVQEIQAKDQPVLNIAHAVRMQAIRKEVKGLKVDPLGGTYFTGVTIE